MPPHRHDREDEAIWVLAGQFEIIVGEDQFITSAGSFAHLPRDITHSHRNVGTRDARFLTVMVPAGLERFFQEIGQPASDPSSPPSIDESDIAHVIEVAARFGVTIEDA